MSNDQSPSSEPTDGAASSTPSVAAVGMPADTPADTPDGMLADTPDGMLADTPDVGHSARIRPTSGVSAPEVEADATARPVEGPPAPRGAFWTRIDRPFVFGFLVTLGGLGAFVLGLALTSLATVLIYIALALFAALGLDPAVRFLERRGLSRAISVVVVILGLVVVFALLLWMVIPIVIDQISGFVGSVPAMVQEFTRTDLYATLAGQFGEQFQDLVVEVQKFLSDFGNLATIGGGALKIGASIATGISGTIIVLVLTLYFLASLSGIKASLLRLAPARDRARASDITDQITDSVGGYVMGMVVLAFFNALLAFLLYFFLGLPFPPLMATVAFCITLIPLVGSVLFWVIGTGIALFTNPIGALIFAVVYLIYMQIEAYVITPRVMNRAISIPGSLVVIGALAGGTLLGLLGALVAVPVTASILIIIKQVWVPRQDARV